MPETKYVEYRLPLDRVSRRTAIMSLPADLSLEEYGRLQSILRALAFGPAPAADDVLVDDYDDAVSARYPEEDSRA